MSPLLIARSAGVSTSRRYAADGAAAPPDQLLATAASRSWNGVTRRRRSGGSSRASPSAEQKPGAVGEAPGSPTELARFLTRSDGFLRQLGRIHHHDSAPLFAEP